MQLTLQDIHEDIESLRQEMKQMRVLLEQESEPSDEVVRAVSLSRKKQKYVSQDAMRKEFGA
ncbi:hypothetical protein HZB02_05835 [Candidatus Woesearchaeota archaeon]|nr:hypothetical protein [Candidatus Woesearchaeota archaeon]